MCVDLRWDIFKYILILSNVKWANLGDGISATCDEEEKEGEAGA